MIDDDLKYAKWNGISWSTSTVDNSGEVGEYTSLDLDAYDRACISYYDRTNGYLKIAELKETTTPEEPGEKENRVTIGNNYINPMDTSNNESIIYYDVPKAGDVAIKVYNLLGEKISTLYDGRHDIGNYTVNWYGKNTDGEIVGSGVYFILYKAGSYTEIDRIMVVK